MFDKYNNIPSTYVPNNTQCSSSLGQSYTKLEHTYATKPYEEYNTKGELIGYSWHQGETINLEFNIDGEITVEPDAIILTRRGQYPSPFEGGLNIRAYNIVDKRSWTCTNIVDGRFLWTEDVVFTYDESSTRSVYTSAEEYLSDKTIEVSIYNFRHEVIMTRTFEGTPKVVFVIDKETSKNMNKGIYYCSLTVTGEDTQTSVFRPQDCTLIVK